MSPPDWIAIDRKPDGEADAWDDVQGAIRRYLHVVAPGLDDTIDDLCRDAELGVLDAAMVAAATDTRRWPAEATDRPWN